MTYVGDRTLHTQVAVVAALVEGTPAFSNKTSLTCPLSHCSVICHPSYVLIIIMEVHVYSVFSRLPAY